MAHRSALLVLLLAVIVGAARAADAGPVEAGARALREQRWSDAETQLRVALERWPGDPDISVLLGIALFHEGRAPEAATVLRHALEAGTVYEARALYYLAMTELLAGDRDGAQSLLVRLLARYPRSREAQKVNEAGVLAATSREGGGASTSRLGEALLLLAAGWDSRPEEVAEHAGNDLGSDSYWLAHASFGLRLDSARLSASFTHLDYAHDDQLDADALRLAAERPVFLDTDSWVPRYSARELWLDRRPYETRHDLSLRWNRHWDEQRETDLTPYAAYKSHVSPYAGESGMVAGLDARLIRHRLDPAMPSLHAGIDADFFGARSRWYGWSEATLYAGAHAALAWAVEADIDLRLRERRYNAVDPLYGERRDDQRAELELILERSLASWLLLQGDALAVSNRSNVDDYRFGRVALSLGLVALY